MEKLIVIMDEMPEYAARLAVYLNGRRGFPYRAVVFSAPEEAKGYIENGAVHAILAAERFEKEVLRLVLKTEVRVLWFCDSKEAKGESFVYRYQSAKEIEKKLTEIEKSKREIRVFGVYSPAGGACMERLAREIGDGFAKLEKVLFLPFLPFGIYGREFGDGMSELLFYVKQPEEILPETFEKLLQNGTGAHCIGPVRWSTELREISKEDVESLLRFLESKTEFDTLVIAIGQADSVGMTVLQCCDAVLTPVWETEEGQKVQAEFLRQLKEAGEAKLLSRIVEFSVPERDGNTDLLQVAAEAVSFRINQG